jgi:hypothetical protein
MPFTSKVGDSFYLPDNNGRHRWIILTKPNAAGYVVIINFTDANNLDCPVIFVPGDHNPFRLRTTICCLKATLVLESKLKLLKVIDYFYFNERQVEKIIKGAIGSLHTPPDILIELKDQYPNY